LLVALAALGLTEPEHTAFEWLLLLAIGAVQIAESSFGWSARRSRALAAFALKLTLCYGLVGATGGIESSYYLIFLLPIVSAASRFGLGQSLLLTAVASALYLSHVLYVLDTYYVPVAGQRELMVRVLFFFLSAVLINRLTTENRLQTERLSQANKELSHAQAEVRRSERLAALGQLSAGLAHEIRNPLGVISASAELLDKNVSGENEVAREVTGFIRTEVNRTNSLVTRFLDFARPSQLDRQMRDLNEIVESALQQFHDGSKQGDPTIEIQARLQPIPRFPFDPTLIESSVLNLLLNAREAMLEGGVLRIETAQEGGFARIEVSDEGSGIESDKIEDVFNPFFTTKPHGVGLGLAMVSKFVDSHGGTIAVENGPSGGAVFRILLPMDKET